MTTLILGATGHIGGPAAEALLARGHPVRLASSRADGVAELKKHFPETDTVQADMASAASMISALNGAEAVFVVTPDFFDERRGAEVLLEALGQLGARPHIVRIQAEVPGVGVEQLPGRLGQPVGRRGHLEARALIEASGLPATFLNVLGYYLDDLLIHFAGPLRQRGELLVPCDRPMCWIDPADLGKAVAAVLAAPKPKGTRLLHLNNGEEPVLFSVLAELLAEGTGKPVRYRDDPDAFLAQTGPMLTAMTGDPEAAAYLLADWQLEREHAGRYRPTPDLARLLGREAVTVREWIVAHREELA